MNTDVLTFNQGIIMMIETAFFLLFYSVYNTMFGTMPIVSILFTTIIFGLWVLSVTIASNIITALDFPLTITSRIPDYF